MCPDLGATLIIGGILYSEIGRILFLSLEIVGQVTVRVFFPLALVL